MFKNKHIVVGICGGIAAFKAAGLVSQLRQQGGDVHCIMTKNATKLVTPITFGELSGNNVTVDMFSNIYKWDVEHIALANLADDMLSTTIMATKAKVLFVPSMNTNMYENPIVCQNIKKLRNLGYEFVEPESGHLACNTNGKGRFPELDKIIFQMRRILYGRHLLKGKNVVISAGGTKENIDPVRYIGNRSSGRMGYAIAKAAAMEDANVTLVSCTKSLPVPDGINVVYVENAREMNTSMNLYYDSSDVVIMAAAVADYRPVNQSDHKIKKEENSSLDIKLELNPDILLELGERKKEQFLVGFAAETNDVIRHGQEKIKKKNLDMLIANDVAMPGAGFNVTTNIASILYKDGTMHQYPKMTKEELGEIIIEKVAERL